MSESERMSHADESYNLYDFNTPVTAQGWQHLDGSNVWSRVVIVNDAKMKFVVRFEENTNEVEDAYLEAA